MSKKSKHLQGYRIIQNGKRTDVFAENEKDAKKEAKKLISQKNKK